MEMQIMSHRAGSTVVTVPDQPRTRIVIWGDEHKVIAQRLTRHSTIVQLLTEARDAVREERDNLVDGDTLKDEAGKPRLDTMHETTAQIIQPLDDLLGRIDAALAEQAPPEGPADPRVPPAGSLRSRLLQELLASAGKPIPAKTLYSKVWGRRSSDRPECVVGSTVTRLRRLGWPIASKTRGSGEEGYFLPAQ